MNRELLETMIAKNKGAQDAAVEKMLANDPIACTSSGLKADRVLLEELYDVAAFDAKWGVKSVTQLIQTFSKKKCCRMTCNIAGVSAKDVHVYRNFELILPPIPEGITMDEILNTFGELQIIIGSSSGTRVQRSNSLADLELLNRFQCCRQSDAKVSPYVDAKNQIHIPFLITVPNFIHNVRLGDIHVNVDFNLQWVPYNNNMLIIEKWLDEFDNNKKFYITVDVYEYETPPPTTYTSLLLQTSFTGDERISLLDASKIRLNTNHPTYFVAVKLMELTKNGDSYKFINFETTDNYLYRNLEFTLLLDLVPIFEGDLDELLAIKKEMGFDAGVLPETLIIPFMDPQTTIANFNPFTEKTLNLSRINHVTLKIAPKDSRESLLSTNSDVDSYNVNAWITTLYNHVYSVHGTTKRHDMPINMRNSAYVFHFSK